MVGRFSYLAAKLRNSWSWQPTCVHDPCDVSGHYKQAWVEGTLERHLCVALQVCILLLPALRDSDRFLRGVPGVAMYMSSLTQLRSFMARSPYFALVQNQKTSNNGTGSRSVLPTLTSTGNLAAGATARVGIGFILNPFSVLKARFESNMYNYTSVSQGMRMMLRNGPSELFRGFLASAMRDAPHAGIFLVFYERIKKDACEWSLSFLKAKN